jgi:type III pantothenate kinase
MILTIDIGNTNVVCVAFDGEKVVHKERMESGMDFWCQFRTFAHHDIEKVIIGSVVPNLTTVYVEASKNLFQIDPVVVTSENCGLVFDVEDKNQVGADRICNAVAAKKLFGTPAIVVDFGTATTYDVVNENGVFIGGAIAPGIDVSARYLFEKAALLEEIKYKFPKSVVGKDTDTNLQSGVMFGAVDAVDGMLNRIIAEQGWKKTHIILTGGFSQLLSPKLKTTHSISPELTLIGLRLITE